MGGDVMRTLRLFLVGTTTLALAGGIGAVTSAQTESDTPASTGSALLSFTLPYPEPSTLGVVEFADGQRFTHEGVFRFTLDSGDPRLSGEMWTINSYYTFPDSGGNVWVGFAGLDDEGGAWRGTYHGYGTPYNERNYLQVDLTGSDAYDGLSAILFATDNGTGFDVEGMIFPGELPPLPEMQEPPAE
jgi:hypothetical protein